MLSSTNLWFNACQQTYKAVKTSNSLLSGKRRMQARTNQQFNSSYSRLIWTMLHLMIRALQLELTYKDEILCNRWRLMPPLKIRQMETLGTKRCKLHTSPHPRTTSMTIQMIKRSSKNLRVKSLICRQRLTPSWRNIKRKEARIRSMNGRHLMKLKQASLAATAYTTFY